MICSWDGEEYALTGSTEWGEEFADELKKKAIAYLNVDSSASGPNFHGTPVASLATVLVDVTPHAARAFGKNALQEWRETRQQQLHETRPARRFGAGRHPHRQRLGSHRLPEFSRHPHRRPGIRRAVRRLSFSLR